MPSYFFFYSFSFSFLCKTLNGAAIYGVHAREEVHLNVLTHRPICRGLKTGLAQGTADEEEAKGNREKASIGICIVTVR